MTPVVLAAGMFQTLFVQLLAFVFLVWVLMKFAKPVLAKALEARSKSIEDSFKKVELDAADASRQMADLKQKLADLDSESKRRHQAALEEASRTRTQALADANAQAQASMDKAKREIEIERDKAILELRNEATELTIKAAEQVVQATMNDAHQDRLVNDYLARLDKVKPT